MKDLIVLFVYSKRIPFSTGGADNESSAAIDRVDGQAYDLWFYDNEKFDLCLSVEDYFSLAEAVLVEMN